MSTLCKRLRRLSRRSFAASALSLGTSPGAYFSLGLRRTDDLCRRWSGCVGGWPELLETNTDAIGVLAWKDIGLACEAACAAIQEIPRRALGRAMATYANGGTKEVAVAATRQRAIAEEFIALMAGPLLVKTSCQASVMSRTHDGVHFQQGMIFSESFHTTPNIDIGSSYLIEQSMPSVQPATESAILHPAHLVLNSMIRYCVSQTLARRDRHDHDG